MIDFLGSPYRRVIDFGQARDSGAGFVISGEPVMARIG